MFIVSVIYQVLASRFQTWDNIKVYNRVLYSLHRTPGEEGCIHKYAAEFYGNRSAKVRLLTGVQ